MESLSVCLFHELIVRMGGGFLALDKMIKTYGPGEFAKTNRRQSIKITN